MGETIVQKKVAKLIQQELGDLFSKEFNYVPGTFSTISAVKVPADLGLAKIYVSVLPDQQLEKVAKALNENAWELRFALAKRIKNKVRKIPELRFYADDSLKEAQRINEMLDRMEIPEENDEQERD